MRQNAPIAVFVYRRAEHTRRMLQSLLQNQCAAASPISIFCDGPRGGSDAADVRQTRAVVSELAPVHARIVQRDANLGLARSVIAGVSELVEKHGEVIVVEDDLVLSPVALEYFNLALERYADAARVMHVSGYMYPVRSPLPETFFYREATCWGWATWARAWRQFEPDATKIRDFVLERGQRREFDVNGSMSFFRMLEEQIHGKIDSWAIRWYGSMRMHDGLALHPGRSLVRNIGLDGTGEHSGRTSDFDVEISSVAVKSFPDSIVEDAAALRAVVQMRRANITRQRISALRNIIRGWARWAGG
jgi:hypothetical protein